MNIGGSAINRITNLGSGIVGTTLGANGGAPSEPQLANRLTPPGPARELELEPEPWSVSVSVVANGVP
jgi:uncharacterized membrane protein